MNPISDPETSPVRPTSLDLRRRRKRRPLAGQTIVSVLDGPRAGDEHETVARDFANDQTSFLLKAELRVGQRVELDSDRDGRATTVLAEVIRSRLLSNGRWEIVVEVRRTPAAPKPSESQRRHERRRLRLARQVPTLGAPAAPVERSI
ncbi:MAG: hypothetical protein QM770_00905 [Tepidisphaeraceae bacterium]